jgi:predicted phosphodiesterase
MKLTELAANDIRVNNLLEDETVGHSAAARNINALFSKEVTSERSVRRYRAHRDIVVASLISQVGSDAPLAQRPRRSAQVPVWTPGIELDPAVGGEFRTRPVSITGTLEASVEPAEAELLQEFGLDPAVWEITSARKSQWQGAGGDWLEASKVSFRKRGSGFTVSQADVEAILGGYKSFVPKLTRKVKYEGTFVVPAGDLQLGKQDGGGTAATVERFARIINGIAQHLEERGGVENLVLPWLGDCIEGYVSQGGRNLVYLDITPVEQVRVYRRLMMHQIAMLTPLARRVLVPVVPGNHDETTRQQIMPHRDSWAIEGAVAVRDWMEGRPEYAHVKFVFPVENEPDLTVDIAGVTVTFMHGHGTGKSNSNSILDWWRKQSHGRQLAGEADILLSAHWHHLRVEASGGNRTWVQIPALDGGSDWFRHHTGDDLDSGIVTFELTPGVSPSWSNMKVWV